MKKLENFSNCLEVLKSADFEMADNNDIYRTGVIGQFNLTFELAWKALQEILKMHGADGAATGSPREILQLGYKLGFVDDAAVWLLMLKKRNTSVHIYNEQEVDEMILLIRDSFIPAFVGLEKTLRSKLEEVKNKYQKELLEVFTRLYNLKRLYDKCRYVVDFSQKASVYTFSSLDLKEVETKFNDIDSIKIIELPVDIYEKRNIIAPVIVKNNTLFQPFENVLSVTLGDVFDPTALVAILTMIISAVCVGDIGVGILLLVLGLLVNIKKPARSAPPTGC